MSPGINAAVGCCMAIEGSAATRQPLDGLTSAEVEARIAKGETNHIQSSPSRTTGEIIRANVVTRFNILLSALLVVALIVADPRDALFGLVMVANAGIGIIQELRAKATLDRLALLSAPKARVVRAGSVAAIAVEDIVLGDVIELRPGDQLAVDGTVLVTRGLEINESLLTGESDPVLKEAGHACLSGSFVAAGSGRYKATRVGAKAYAAALAAEAKRFALVRSELREGIDWFLGAVSWAVGPVMILLIWSQQRADVGVTNALRSAVAGAVGMIPQGLVLLTSVAFAVSVVRLGKRNVLVQELPAIEGLARVDTVCFDKTGTLTVGTLVVQKVEPLSDVDASDALGALGAADPDPNATLRAIATRFEPPSDWVAEGSVPFSSARKWSGATFRGHGSWVLGAPEILAPTNADAMDISERFAADGYRVVLLGRSEYKLQSASKPRGLEPVALIVLGDEIRPDAADTLRYFAEQGVTTKVISGDHPNTVAAIARQVGVPGSHEVFDARELPEDLDELAEVMERGTVFGRVTPYQKRAMVDALQSRNHVVAMTGDGVNDVLALKNADIGIAVGTGSGAARAVAQLVLIDGSFDTLPGVVAEGRRVIANIERVANLFVTKTVYAICLAIAISLLARPFPFLPRHLTLVGSVTIGIPAFFLALAPSARRAQRGLIRRVLRFSIPTGLAAGFATLIAYELAIGEEVTLQQARTTATIVLAAVGLFALGIVGRPLVPWKKWLIGTMTAILVLLSITPGSQRFFDLRLPRNTVLLAAVGIVSITGFLMIGTLRAVGWIRHVPEALREGPTPGQIRTVAAVRSSIGAFTSSLRWSNLSERLRFWRPDDEPMDEAALPPPIDEDVEPIEWLDVDVTEEVLLTPDAVDPDR